MKYNLFYFLYILHILSITISEISCNSNFWSNWSFLTSSTNSNQNFNLTTITTTIRPIESTGLNKIQSRDNSSKSLNNSLHLYNGTLLRNKNVFPTIPGYLSSKNEIEEPTTSHLIYNRIKRNSTQTSAEGSHQNKIKNKGDSDSEGRLIGLQIAKPTIKPKFTSKLAKFPQLNINLTQNAVQQIPKVTVASILRKIFFPDWLWQAGKVKFIRRAGLPSASSTITTANNLKQPTISFDNNFNRFLRLFTKVRFENGPCQTDSGQNGTCYHSTECSTIGGVGSTSCAGGFGVCCIFELRCGGATAANGSYIVGDESSVGTTGRICSVQIHKTTPTIKQMRLDFLVFKLQQPKAGTCDTDRFVVSGQKTNNIIPILCGENTGQHIWIETEGSSSGITINIETPGDGSRSWNIWVTQFEGTEVNSTPPPYCLQYHSEVAGNVQSFNYISTPSQYLNNLDYAICIRKESGYCSITYTVNGPDGFARPFSIINLESDGTPILPPGRAGIGLRKCPFDYVLINGVRLCNDVFNDASVNFLDTVDAPVTDTSPGPFTVTVRSNAMDVAGGFNLFYRQNPCMSTPG